MSATIFDDIRAAARDARREEIRQLIEELQAQPVPLAPPRPATIFDELRRQAKVAERDRFIDESLGEPWEVPEGPAKLHRLVVNGHTMAVEIDFEEVTK